MKQTIRTIIALGATIFLAACGGKKEAEKNNATQAATDSAKVETKTVELSIDQYRTLGITVGDIEMRQLSGNLKVSGILEAPPQSMVSISTQMGGIVKSTPLLQGSSVSKGQVIAVLQNQDFVQLQQDYLDTRSQLEYQQTEYERQLQLQRENVNAQKTLQSAKAQYNSLQAKAAGLRQRLKLINIDPDRLSPATISSDIKIYAPVSGSVTKVNVNVGKFVNPNDVMFEIVNVSELHVELNVFEKDLPKLRVGQRVRFSLGNETSQRAATIQLIGKEIGPDKTVRVHASATLAGDNFLPGTYLTAFIETALSDLLTLPEAAVVDFEGKKYIFVVKLSNPQVPHEHKAGESEAEKKKLGDEIVFELMEVTTGTADGGYVEVVLPPNVEPHSIKAVTKGAYDLLSKMKNSAEED